MSTAVNDKRSPKGQKPLTSNSLKTQYLILYNFVSALLWLVVLCRVLMLVPLVGFTRVYDGVGKFTRMTQSLALLEVLHSAAGIVRAPISTTAMQVASRLLLVWIVVNPFPFVAKSPGYSSMLIAWSVTEVIRYSYFVFNLSGYNPKIIMWLRYNTFYVLYPLGIGSECWLLSKAIAPAGTLHQGFAWFLQITRLIYIPGSYILFTHMISQRKKVLKAAKAAKAA
ncbi:putative very-long-chain -3-hydroxyacyl-CoA dehydratase [Erysiphe neolycopersici]|uniref:Very-long-chain (3R)-3-hydroxyacyl-CoA dehydratase n=1 Tax=Erysiphe neolycopersici TaxID=212602 RepID=A0A420HZG7_9PEZI|nr:putative very-long-chain -3-hydroxyacyl-CoA dehydratase [Erysiphe neolycopersici]